jgi:hypothetical protein
MDSKNIKAQYNAHLTFVGGTDDNRWIDRSKVATTALQTRNTDTDSDMN